MPAVYDFTRLSNLDFEELVQELLRHHYKIEFEAFRTIHLENAEIRGAMDSSRTAIAHCRHGPHFSPESLLERVIKVDVPALRRLAPRRCFLVTSLDLLDVQRVDIHEALRELRCEQAEVLTGPDVLRLLKESPKVADSNFKLWLASAEVLERARKHAIAFGGEFAVEPLYSNLRPYVANENYRQAIEMLRRDNVLVISGPPGIGKTTLADLLLFSFLERGYQPIRIRRSVAQGRELFNPRVRQVFHFDDFLGATFLGDREGSAGGQEDEALREFIRLVQDSGTAKLLLTTREHILEAAAASGRAWAGGALDSSGLKLREYSTEARSRILYNHLYFSDLPRAYQTQLVSNDFYTKILDHTNFSPRLVEMICEANRVAKTPVEQFQSAVLRDLEAPESVWVRAFEGQLSEGARSLLLALVSFGGSCGADVLENAWRQLHEQRARRATFRPRRDTFSDAIRELRGAFVIAEAREVKFRSASVTDAAWGILDLHEEYVTDLIASSTSLSHLSRTWLRCTSVDGKPLQNHFAANAELLVETLEHLLATRANLSLEMQFWLLASMASTLDLRPLWDMVDEISVAMTGSWLTEAPNFSATLSALTWMDRSGKPERMRKAVLKELVSKLPNARARDFGRVVQFSKSWATLWTSRNQAALLDAFVQYIDAGFSEDIKTDDTQVLSDVFGIVVPLSQLYDEGDPLRVVVDREWKHARRTMDRNESHKPTSQSGLQARIAVETVHDADAVRDQFQSLLED